MNNPVYFIDPDGMQSIRNNENGTVHSPETDQLDGVVAGVTIYSRSRSNRFDLSGLWFLQNSGSYNKYSFTNTALRSYQNMMSTENGRTYYNNLHNSKLSKQMDNVALGYMGLLALPMASAVVVEYGSLMKTTIDMAAQGVTTGEINGIAALAGSAVPGNSLKSVIGSGMVSEQVNTTMENLNNNQLTNKSVFNSFITSGVKAAISGPVGTIGGNSVQKITSSSTAGDIGGAIMSSQTSNEIDKYK